MDEATLDAVHAMLSNRRRRHLLKALYNYGPMWKDELEEYITAAVYQKDVDELEEDELKNVRPTVHQDHLPPLVKHNFVVWDEESNAVAFGPDSHLVLRKHDGIELENGPQWLVNRL